MIYILQQYFIKLFRTAAAFISGTHLLDIHLVDLTNASPSLSTQFLLKQKLPRQALETTKMAKSKAAFISKLYQMQKESLRTKLSTVTFQLPHIIDIDWRLDYFMKSNKVEKANESVFFINLKTKTDRTTGQIGDTEKEVEFTCNLEQLQDLLLKLKDAEKSLSRNL